MFLAISTWVIVTSGVLALLYILRCACARTPKFNLNDLVHFLYPVDLSLLDSLLDPAADFALRWSLNPRAFRREQRRRMRLYRELLRRMAHNSIILADFGNALFGEDERPACACELEGAVIKVRLYTGFARLRLRLWLLLSLDALGVVPTPQLANLRKAADLDGRKAYDELKIAAAAAFARLQPAELDALTRNL
jgi:hypothetical protein